MGYVGYGLCQYGCSMMYIRQGVFFEKKHGLEMAAKLHSNIKYMRGTGAIGGRMAKCRLLVAISGIQGSRGIPHHLT